MKRIFSLLLILLLAGSAVGLTASPALAADSVSQRELDTKLAGGLSIAYLEIGLESITVDTDGTKLDAALQPRDVQNYDASPISTFINGDGDFCYLYASKKTASTALWVTVDKDTFAVAGSVSITTYLTAVGGAICDGSGNLYVVYGGSCTTDYTSLPVLTVAKYSPSGLLLGSVSYTAAETALPQSSAAGVYATKPFDSGNCSLAISGSTLCCLYGRKDNSSAFAQSGGAILVDIASMSKLTSYSSLPYTVQSWNCQLIATDNSGSFLAVEQGDAYDRGFCLTAFSKAGASTATAFHFREGANRATGYKEVYSQLGGIDQSGSNFILTGTSERTLSLAVAPTNITNYGYSETRDLFMQTLNSSLSSVLINGVTRAATGTATAGAKTPLFLSSGVSDSGVLWLTEYQLPYYAASPRSIVLPNGNVLILWEVWEYSDGNYYDNDTFITTWSVIVGADGSIVQPAVRLGNDVRLDPQEELRYSDGYVYWCYDEIGDYTLNGTEVTVYRLPIEIWATTPTPSPTPSPTPTPAPTATPDENIEPKMLGDVNGDGKVSAADAAMVLRYCVKLIPLNSRQITAANVSGDTLVNAQDAACILRYCVKLILSFE